MSLSLQCVESFHEVHECDAEWVTICSAFLLQLVYNVDVVCRGVSASESSLISWLGFVNSSIAFLLVLS